MQYIALMLEWSGPPETAGGVTERRFGVARETGLVPGVLWAPAESDAAVPLVLLGHGGGGHKRDESRLDYAHAYVREHGFAAAAIDGPYHGERAPRAARTVMTSRSPTRWSGTGGQRSTFSPASTRSTGTASPTAASRCGRCSGCRSWSPTGGRARPCSGSSGSWATVRSRRASSPRLARDAPRLRCPTLFLMQWDDELFARDGVLALFDLIGADDKRLYANPGGHAATPEHVRTATSAFIAEQLRA